jgi:hypothetical protein
MARTIKGRSHAAVSGQGGGGQGSRSGARARWSSRRPGGEYAIVGNGDREAGWPRGTYVAQAAQAAVANGRPISLGMDT